MTSLPKHLRPRYRYLAVALESWPDRSLDRTGLAAALETSLRGLYGDAGVAAVDPRIVRFTFEDGAGSAVVRSRRDHVDRARAGLVAIPAVDGAPLAVNVTGISGTVRGCEEKYLHGRQLPHRETTVTFEGDSRPALARGSCVDVRLSDGFAGATDLDTN